jgi:dienelactone hydrolase
LFRIYKEMIHSEPKWRLIVKSRPDCTGKIGATGFCYGGGMANNLSVLLGPDLAAAAPF